MFRCCYYLRQLVDYDQSSNERTKLLLCEEFQLEGRRIGLGQDENVKNKGDRRRVGFKSVWPYHTGGC